uniref:AIG1-type G domain-containing protein n=1 Tax=Denticeps clupeoides TaxID=299321 RepID=A0AAY4DRL1_9TELE
PLSKTPSPHTAPRADTDNYSKLTAGNPSIYRLNQKQTGNGQFRKMDSFKPSKKNPRSKTTLVNGMINYVLGVKWEDGFRFKLIDEETNRTQAESQTSEVTAYQIHHTKDSVVPFSLTIIDTPGFGDTRGIKKDQELTEKIREFFTQKDGLPTIDAVCFVVQSALARLTHTQKYIFQAILSIFGKDIEDNIVAMITFADGKAPPVLESIKAADIPCAKKTDQSTLHFKFNNSALYATNGASEDDDDGEDNFDQMFWKMGTASLKRFFDHLGKMEAQSLQLTKEVLEERKRLEVTVEQLPQLIRFGLGKLDEIKTTRAALDQHKSCIEANKDFEYEVEIQKTIKVDIPSGKYITNCIECNYTCHYPCFIPNDADKRACSAMDTNGYCDQCPGKCVWNVHYNMRYRFDIELVKEKRTYENLKKQYEDAMGEKMNAEKIVQNLEEQYKDIQLDVLEMIVALTKLLARLKEIALRPDPLTTPDYIDMLIQSEQSECKPGYKQRIAELQDVLKRAQLLQSVANGKIPGTEENSSGASNPGFTKRCKDRVKKLWSEYKI